MDIRRYLTPEVLFAATGQRYDAGETAAFARELEYIITELYNVEYPDRKARQLLPVDSRPSPGSDSFTWRQFDRLGQAAIIDNYAGDFPSAEIVGNELTTKIKSLGVSYQYSIQDLRAAAFIGRPLDTMKALAARESMEDLVEKLAAVGDTNTGLVGFTNAPNIGSFSPSAGATSGKTAWFNSSGVQLKNTQEILGDVNAIQKTIFTATKGLHEPDTLVLPTNLYACLATTARSPTFTEDSILQYILKQSPWLKSIEFWPRLDTAGASSVPRVMMYQRNPRVVQMVIPQEFEQLPPQPRLMSFVIPCHMRFGGVSVKYPLAVCYADGCDGSS